MEATKMELFVCGSAANYCLLLDNLKSKDDDQHTLIRASSSMLSESLSIEQIILGTKCGLAIDRENNLQFWGEDESGQQIERPISIFQGKILFVSAGFEHLLFVTD